MDAAAPSFLLVTPDPVQAAFGEELAHGLADRLAPVLGFAPEVRAVALDLTGAPTVEPGPSPFDAALDETVAGGTTQAYVLPLALDLSIFLKQRLVEVVRGARRRHGDLQLYYDDVDPCHPLLLSAFIHAAGHALQRLQGATPGRTGVLLVASGDGDPSGRARAYQLMRLLWEELSCARGEVAFLRHDRTPVPEQLEACARLGLDWVVVPELLWPSEHLEYARVLCADFDRKRGGPPWPVAEPIGAHPNVLAWIEQRALALWREQRARQAARRASPRRAGATRRNALCGPRGRSDLIQGDAPIEAGDRFGDAVIADLPDPAGLATLLRRHGLDGAERVFVKVTWHGYAPGTYTDPTALDALLSALPGPCTLIEGHTASRNRGEAGFDWEREAREHRGWIHAQEAEYLERTGLSEVMARHGASYVNVTEAFWDGACADPAQVHAVLDVAGVELHHPELAGLVPQVLFEHRGAPLISFARFKGPTRLAVSNLFGLLPGPLRSEWHGPNITYFARVCTDLARLYGCLFELHGVVESLHAAVRWDRGGLYRSRWGNYDLVHSPGLVTLSPGVAGCDVLASRLQGQDVTRSAFFDVVRSELGYDPALEELPIDAALVRRFV